MNVVERIRVSGKCPPSLMRVDSDTDFETMAVKVIDANGMSIACLYRPLNTK